jgi:cold shock CspA family protein
MADVKEFDRDFDVTGDARRPRRIRRDRGLTAGTKVVAGRMIGHCEVFSLVNGYGNAQDAEGKSYFVHESQIRQTFTSMGFRALMPGMIVTFVRGEDNSGRPQANFVQIEEHRGATWSPFQMEARKNGKGEEPSNVWSAVSGVIHINLLSGNGIVDNNIIPALYIADTETALFHTNQDAKQFAFTLPSDSGLSALALDKDKNPVAPDKVSFGGFILLAKRNQNGDIVVLVRRFGKRYDKDTRINAIVVEQRLKLNLGPAPVAAEVESKIRADAHDLRIESTVGFVPLIMTAIEGLR